MDCAVADTNTNTPNKCPINSASSPRMSIASAVWSHHIKAKSAHDPAKRFWRSSSAASSPVNHTASAYQGEKNSLTS